MYGFLFQSRIMSISKMGFLSYWMNIYWPRTNRCSAPFSTRESEKAEKLTMNYLSGPFLLRGGGMLISLGIFVLEIIHYQWYQHFQRRLAPIF